MVALAVSIAQIVVAGDKAITAVDVALTRSGHRKSVEERVLAGARRRRGWGSCIKRRSTGATCE